MPLSFIFVVGVFAATADLVFRQLRWRRNSTAALSPPVFSSPSLSPPPSPPESAERPSPLSRMSKSFVMKSFDENQDGMIDEAEAAAIAEHLAQQAAAEREAQKEAARERKISQVFRRFALVLLLALLASVGINAGLTAGIVYAVKDTRVGDGAQLPRRQEGAALGRGGARGGDRGDVGVCEDVIRRECNGWCGCVVRRFYASAPRVRRVLLASALSAVRLYVSSPRTHDKAHSISLRIISHDQS